MDLSRRVLEDLISLEYMLFKDKEAYAKKFFACKAVEEKLDIDFFEATGVAIDQQLQQIMAKDARSACSCSRKKRYKP